MKSVKWFYDNSGYYSYILLNGPSDILDGVQTILRQQRIRILLSGRSFRPAGNGKQYDWYIRINETNAPYHAVKNLFSQRRYGDILFQEEGESYTELPGELHELFQKTPQITIEKLSAALQQKQLEISELQQFKKLYQALMERYQNQASELEETRKRNNQLETDSSNLKVRLRQLAHEIEELKQFHQKYLEVRTQLKTAREKNHQLQTELSTTHRSNSKSRDLAEINLKLQQDLTKKEEELNQWMAEFEAELDKKDAEINDKNIEINQWLNEIEKRDKDIITLNNQIAQLNHEKSQLIENFYDSSKTDISSENTTSAEKLFQTTLQVFATNIEFLAGSLQSLWQEIENPDKILKDLAKLHKLKGERVESLGGWLERRYSDWRLYYQFYGTNGQCRVLISAKKTQQHDIEWLKTQ